MDGEHPARAPRAEKLRGRKESCAFIKSEWGIDIAPSTLAKYASIGGGPNFTKFKRRVYYSEADLARWVEEQLNGPRRG